MKRGKAFLVATVILFLLGIVQCDGSTPTPTPTPCDTSALETQVADCEAARIKAAEEARATIGALEAALATCEAGPTDTVEPPKCVERLVCPEAISAEHAIEFVGETKTVQGPVVDTYFCHTCSGQPTFLNLCYKYEDSRRFTALIWGEDRQEFIDCVGGLPEVILLNREICVKGLIELYDGIPEIILKECHQLAVLQ